MKKSIALLLCLLLSLSAFCACESRDTAPETTPTASPTEATRPKIPSVRFLCFQPELAELWLDLAAAYTAETGVPVTVTTDKPDNWRETLDSLLSSEDAPTLFQLIRPTADDRWEALCYDLSDTDAAGQLMAADYALTQDEAIWGLPCSLDAWGIWVNKALLSQAGFSPEDITSLESLKAVCDSITADGEALGFSAFSGSAGDIHMDLAATAIAWEFQEEDLTDPSDFRGTSLDGLRSLLDTMLLNSPEESGSAPFLEGKAVFCPGSSADWDALSEVFAAGELALIPAFLQEPEQDAEETTPEETVETQPTEETQPQEDDPQGLCIGAEVFWCVNPDAPEQDLSATLTFLDWCLGTGEGAAALAAMGYDLPFLTAPESGNPFLPDPEDAALLPRRDWAMPSQQWKSALSSALADYTADPSDGRWARVAEVFADYWAAEYALNDPTGESTEP